MTISKNAEYRFLVSLDPSFTRTGICIIDLENKHIMFYTASNKIGEKQFENVVHAATSVVSQIENIITFATRASSYNVVMESPLPMSSMSSALYSLDTLIYHTFEQHVKKTYNPATLKSQIHGHKYEKRDSQNLAEKYIKVLIDKGYSITTIYGTKRKIPHDCCEALLYAHLYLHDNEHPDFQFDNSEDIKAFNLRKKELKKKEKALLNQTTDVSI